MMDYFDYDAHTKNANAAKTIVLGTLFENDSISREDFEEYSTKWGIVIIKPKWFQKLFKGEEGHKAIFVQIKE